MLRELNPASEIAAEWLLARQDPQGWWSGELETNVTMVAEQVLLYRFLGLSLDPLRAGAIRHLLHFQRDDGSWALYHDGPADLSTTIEAYVALKVLGVGAQPRALRIIRRLGGVASARVFTKIWLALFGKYPWDGIPTMPPELIYLSPKLPFNLYDFACWARGTIAPLTIVIARRPVRPLGVSLGEVLVEGAEPDTHRVSGSGAFWWLDRLLKHYERSRVKPGRERSCSRVARWIVERQEADGSWGGIQPPWVYSLIALSIEGYALDHPVMRRGLEGMERFTITDKDGRRIQACMSPVWDTAWALRALIAAGLRSDHPAIGCAIDWLLGEQISRGGDWQIRCSAPGCGGWAFEFDNDIYPDVDDTAVVVSALIESGNRSERVQTAIARAEQWVRAMRSRNGGWASFDRDNTRDLVYRLPFADFGAMTDPPTEDVTAHVLEMLALLGRDTRDSDLSSAYRFLSKTQKPGGSWYGRWGVNYIYGTWCAMTAIAALHRDDELLGRGAQWLLKVQNADGGWGESPHSYVDESFAGIGTSTPSQTAWALLALQSAGLHDRDASARGRTFLRERCRDGTWNEPEHTGTGFPGDFYINYHLYRHLFPMMALGGRST
ncbi:MAG: squalene--hopene cyclase [Candidatus Baltobacteraceae bacterium]